MIVRARTGFAVGCCLALAFVVPAAAQPQDSVPEALRRLLDVVPGPRLVESLGLRSGVIAMDGEASVRVPPDAARLRVGVTSEGASPTEVAQQNERRRGGAQEGRR